ncbi:MAG TPA: hypothetical protein VJN96_03145 [Vicinamibacterales bacterium]|nr:hypothetical protein [Vicinamibacterales bacterium]
MRFRVCAVAGLVATLTLTSFACKSAPSQKPFGGADVNTGPGSVEFVRRQLMGTWRLQQFQTADASGQLHPVRADATLTYDQFGNMKVDGSLLEPLPGQPPPPQSLQAVLRYTGRVAIDTDKHELRLLGQEGQADPSLQSSVGAQLARRYEIDNDKLTLTFVDAQGKTTAKAFFQRAK